MPDGRLAAEVEDKRVDCSDQGAANAEQLQGDDDRTGESHMDVEHACQDETDGNAGGMGC